ncbi:hypothetical protein [Paraburkholderia kururiensis]|jgi:hypothetical protein|uniref:Uncharacterized protein n=1 Tax=Paraburkholderia kururiensis TaxID=984307 RepID=A0ABZ0WKU4_9BURK|nr:hypothetical protein [Paraburkholderia kururiensis]WQD77981.1 hypothetical protein U0042_28860 [Paraburkholderia kururiensis]
MKMLKIAGYCVLGVVVVALLVSLSAILRDSVINRQIHMQGPLDSSVVAQSTDTPASAVITSR